jgi:hypothetical protein
MSDVSFARGEWIFRKGDPGDRAYLVREGEVEILSGAEEPFTRTARITAGAVFGDMSLVEERPRSLGARALTNTIVTPMTRDEFEKLLTSNPLRARQYLRSLFERLRMLSAKVADLPLPAEPAAKEKEAAPEPAAKPFGPVAFPVMPGADVPLLAPSVVVHPLTRKAAETLPDDGLKITTFPLRIGRAEAPDEQSMFDLNDLWLLDVVPYHVSRNHCSIDLDDQNRVIVRDRGSHLGCFVNEEHIGGRSPYGYTRLHEGDNVLILGGRVSPYQFRVTVG